MQQQQSIKDASLARAWACVKQVNRPEDRHGLPAKTWAAMSHRARSVLVMLGAKTAEDPRELARRPWGSLSDTDRDGIAACAKELSRDLRDAACLF
jgi:hypothetical protein